MFLKTGAGGCWLCMQGLIRKIGGWGKKPNHSRMGVKIPKEISGELTGPGGQRKKCLGPRISREDGGLKWFGLIDSPRRKKAWCSTKDLHCGGGVWETQEEQRRGLVPHALNRKSLQGWCGGKKKSTKTKRGWSGRGFSPGSS